MQDQYYVKPYHDSYLLFQKYDPPINFLILTDIVFPDITSVQIYLTFNLTEKHDSHFKTHKISQSLYDTSLDAIRQDALNLSLGEFLYKYKKSNLTNPKQTYTTYEEDFHQQQIKETKLFGKLSERLEIIDKKKEEIECYQKACTEAQTILHKTSTSNFKAILNSRHNIHPYGPTKRLTRLNGHLRELQKKPTNSFKPKILQRNPPSNFPAFPCRPQDGEIPRKHLYVYGQVNTGKTQVVYRTLQAEQHN